VSLDQTACYGEAETGAARAAVAGIFESHEGFQNRFALFQWNARSLVVNG
jgi:hypothetical protein